MDERHLVLQRLRERLERLGKRFVEGEQGLEDEIAVVKAALKETEESLMRRPEEDRPYLFGSGG